MGRTTVWNDSIYFYLVFHVKDTDKHRCIRTSFILARATCGRSVHGEQREDLDELLVLNAVSGGEGGILEISHQALIYYDFSLKA